MSKRLSMTEKTLNVLSIAFGLILALGILRLALGYANLRNSSEEATSDEASSMKTAVGQTSGPQSVALILRSTCQYCRQSAPLHRWLAESSTRHRLNLVVLTDEPAADAEEMLRAEEISVAKVKSVDLAKLGLSTTPSIVVLSASGDIQKTFQGVLSAPRQLELAKLLNLTLDSPFVLREKTAQPVLSRSSVTEEAISELSQFRPGRYIVDVRPRSGFVKGHLPGALNVPIDELGTRLAHELPPGAEVLVYCHYQSACESAQVAKGIPTYCTLATQMVASLGFNARLLKFSLNVPRPPPSNT